MKYYPFFLIHCHLAFFFVGSNHADSQLFAAEPSAKTFTHSATGMEFVHVPGGTLHGGTSQEMAAQILKESATLDFANFPALQTTLKMEVPPKTSTVLSFYIGKYEVTRAQFKRFVDATGHVTRAEKEGGFGIVINDDGSIRLEKGKDYHWRNPGFEQDDAHPVVNVDRVDALYFTLWLTNVDKESDKRRYRLPLGKEWEYACRAGSAGHFSFGGDPSLLNRTDNTADASFTKSGASPIAGNAIATSDNSVFTSRVGAYSANALGIYDMHGNVSEHCHDGLNQFTDKPRFGLVKGGNFLFGWALCRSAYSEWVPGVTATPFMGFRVATSK